MKQDIAIVIPCYRVSDSIAGVVRSALEHADLVICVDDACPEHSGRLVQSEFNDHRVRVLFNERNLGVGGAVKAGYREALATGSAVVLKLDGDGQMDPSEIPLLTQPILAGDSDCCKGNRFHEVHFGLVTGVVAWSRSIETGIPASSGTVMLAGLPVILGFQLLLSFLNFDIQNQPRQPLGRLWRRAGRG